MEQLPPLPLEEHFQGLREPGKSEASLGQELWEGSWMLWEQQDTVEALTHLLMAAQLLLSTEGTWPCSPSRVFPCSLYMLTIISTIVVNVCASH